MGDADKAQTGKHDPRAYLDEAEASLRIVAESYWDEATAHVGLHLAKAQTYATMATAAAMLMPTPEEVIETYQATRGEVLGEVEAELITRVERAKRILGDAQRDGSRRHPALHAALAALDGDLDG